MPTSETRFQKLPRGRLLYQSGDDRRYVVVTSARTKELWLVEDGWSADSAAWGPFREEDVLRAVRLATTRVPEGCERGPWQPGTGLFARSKLPAPLDAWSPLDAAWLAPAVAVYSASDIDGVVNETCCAPPRDEPHVAWAASTSRGEDELRALVAERLPELRLTRVGALEAPWNAHPAGSPLLADVRTLSGVFVVVDTPSG